MDSLLQPPALLLWDIDHTLVDCSRVTGRAYDRAFRRITGQPLGPAPGIAGATARHIAARALGRNEPRPSDALVQRLLDAVDDEMDRLGESLAAEGHRMPGAARALTALAGSPGIRQTVLTGNTRRSAATKLRAFGLDQHLDLAIGAYGDEAEDRTALLPLARERARRSLGTDCPPARIVVVGDTPRDIAVGRTHGVRAVGVARHAADASELMAVGADAVLHGLADTEAVLLTVGGLLRQRSAERPDT
ncbi:haloacid dehalogenase-like hydrolase [Streptomyces sp. NBC_00464]|uniref:HAD family hydrolase n=1 Tax=Streptomyces sp. NBC_00464 TaxID=2975751 RepID=UPI002E17D9A1